MDHKTIQSDFGEIHYWIQYGQKETIFFTHGATMDHNMFNGQINSFIEHTIITWDVPAHGLSRPFNSFSLRISAELMNNILEKENINKTHLVGQSMGGYISQIFACEYSEKSLSICAVDSSPLKIDYYSRMDRWLLAMTPGILKLYPYNYLIKSIAKGVSYTEEGKNYALDTLKTLSKGEIALIMKEVYKGLLEYSTKNVEFTIPFLLICGKLDKSGKVISYCKRWSKEENLELIFLENASHNSNVDNPDDFNRTLQEFLITKP